MSLCLCGFAVASDRLLVLARQNRTPYIPGLVNWFSAPPRSAFTAAGTTNISAWYDRLSRIPMGNSVSSNQPALTASSYVHFTKAALDLLDGQGVIDFYSGSPFNPATRPFTFAAIFKPLASAGPAGLLGGRAYISSDVGASQIDWAYLVLGNDLFHQLPNEIGNGAITSTLTGVLATNSLTCLVGLVDGTNFTVRINGRYYQQGTTQSHPLTRDPSSDFFTGAFIDNAGPPQNGAQMDIYEILAGEAMDTAGMLRIERALHILYPSIAFTNYPVLGLSGSLLLSGPELTGPYPDGALHLTNLGNGDLSWSTSSTNYNGIAMFKATPFTGTIAAGATADITLTVLNVNNWFSGTQYGSAMSITNVSNAAGTTNFTVTLEPF